MKLLASAWGLVQVVAVVLKLTGAWRGPWLEVLFMTWAPAVMLGSAFIVYGVLELKDWIGRRRG